MTRTRILLDIDGVAADFITPCLEAIFAYTGVRYAPARVIDWDIMKALNIPDALGRAIYASMERPGLCRDIRPYPGAAEGIAQLRVFADVWAVTAPFSGDHWLPERDVWLRDVLGFKSDHILHVRSAAKPAIRGDVLVEDKVSTLEAWAAAHRHGVGVLFERDYNRGQWSGPTVRSWPALVAALTPE